jgi:hypothetical protein
MSNLNNQLELSISSLENLNIQDCQLSDCDIEDLKLMDLNQLLNDSRFFRENEKNCKNSNLKVENDYLNDVNYKNDRKNAANIPINTEIQNYMPIYQVYLNQQEQEQLEYMKNNNTFCISDYLYWYFNIVEERRSEGRLIILKKYKTK